MDIVQKMLMMFNGDTDLLKKFITGDESWLYGYDIETKATTEKNTSSAIKYEGFDHSLLRLQWRGAF